MRNLKFAICFFALALSALPSWGGNLFLTQKIGFKIPIKCLTIANLTVSTKYENINRLLARAVYEGKFNDIEALRLRRLFASSKAGDYKLLKCLQQSQCTPIQAKKAASSSWPRYLETKQGTILFQSPHEKGVLGDYLTARRLTGMHYEKLPAKYNNLHGIDGIYVKKDRYGAIQEIKIVENKVDRAGLNPGPPKQMSNAWIKDRLRLMLAAQDPDTRKNAMLVLDYLINAPSKISKELWHHDLASGVTTVKSIDADGFPHTRLMRFKDRLIENTLLQLCQNEKLICKDYVY